MVVARLPQFFFALLISIGLVVAPLATPASVGVRLSEDSIMQMADMSGDMPCCPEKKQGDCQDCTLLTICMAKVLQSEPSAAGLPPAEVASRALLPFDELARAGLTRPPPDQPPRTRV